MKMLSATSKSIKLQIVGFAVIVLLGMHFFYAAIWLRQSAEAQMQLFKSEIDNAMSVTTSPVATSLWEFDVDRAMRALDGLEQSVDYRFGRVVTGDEVFLHHSVDGEWSEEWDAALDAQIDAEVERQASEQGALPGIVVATRPLVYEGRTLGSLQLAFSTVAMQTERLGAIWRSVTIGLAFATVIAVAVSLLLAKLLAPLSHLADAVRRFSAGEGADCGPYLRRDDEIGELARAIELLQKSHCDARTDSLTGLPNRRALDDLLPVYSKAGPYAVFFVDLDDFKPINDGFGHRAGDFVLKVIASRLEDRTGDAGQVLRLGGDEFAVIVPGLADRDAAVEMGERFADAVCAPIALDREEAYVGASIGVALSTLVGATPTDMVSAADAAMYAVKPNTAQRVAVFEPSLSRRRFAVKEWRELEAAFSEGQIEPWLQPQLCLKTGRVLGFEALARWRHPKNGIVPPGVFLPMIEELRMQRRFDTVMLSGSLRTLRELRARGADSLRMSVNLTEGTLAQKEGLQDLLWLLDEYADLRDSVTLEITEDVFTARSADAIRRSLNQLFETGVRLSMDDFGTGYGSFRHLQEYDFHELKIDRRFVSAIGQDSSSEVLIKGFLAIAEGLGAEVVAEGVETGEQLAFLKEQNCQAAQGYYFAKPMPVSEAFDAVLAEPFAHAS